MSCGFDDLDEWEHDEAAMPGGDAPAVVGGNGGAGAFAPQSAGELEPVVPPYAVGADDELAAELYAGLEATGGRDDRIRVG